MKNVCINRKRWHKSIPGDYCFSGNLYTGRKQDKACCLGHVAHFAFGVPWKDLRDHAFINSVDNLDNYPALDKWERDNRSILDRAMEVNDSANYSQKEREELIQEILAAAGIRVFFYGSNK
jgi:hypothetical protein